MLEPPEEAFGTPTVVWRTLRVLLRGKPRDTADYHQAPQGNDAVIAALEAAS